MAGWCTMIAKIGDRGYVLSYGSNYLSQCLIIDPNEGGCLKLWLCDPVSWDFFEMITWNTHHAVKF
jgi:hypothetical protein